MTRQQLRIECDLCVSTLILAAQKCGPAFIYELTIHPDRLAETKHWLLKQDIGALANPLSPAVNVRTDANLGVTEWYVAANGQEWGSRGVT